MNYYIDTGYFYKGHTWNKSRLDEALKENIMSKDVITCSCARWYIHCILYLSRQRMWITEPELFYFTLLLSLQTVECVKFSFLEVVCILKPPLNLFWINSKKRLLDLSECFLRGENKRELTPLTFFSETYLCFSYLITSYYPIWQPFQS